ncbi:MAG: leucine-rich repeat domain-containing protein [Lachnospiraceae bacterium]|nr:leucine-rich repeat domain-containing protein [Lachnospiraceae bacterium]
MKKKKRIHLLSIVWMLGISIMFMSPVQAEEVVDNSKAEIIMEITEPEGNAGIPGAEIKDMPSWKDPATGIVYALDTTAMEAIVYKYEGSLAAVTIPANITDEAANVYKVVGIGCSDTKLASNENNYAFNSNKIITSVSYEKPENIRFIGEYAFNYCSNLTGAAPIPSGVIYLGSSAFMYNSKIETATIPTGVKELKLNAFCGCKSLTTVTFPDGLETIGPSAFNGCEKLTGVTLPQNLKCIRSSAFNNCVSMTGQLLIPSGVEHIESSAFMNCTGLTGPLSLPAGLKSMGRQTFYGCTGLTGEVTIPSGVTSIETGAFYDCTGLSKIHLHDNITMIDYLAFQGCTGLTGEFHLPAKLKSIEFGILKDCTNITSVVIPDSVTEIDKQAFMGCENLTGIITIPEQVTKISDEMFSGCTKLTGVVIPAGLKSIGMGAFYECSNLREVIFPESLQTIGEEAFYKCNQLAGDIAFGNQLTEIGPNAFQNCNLITGITFSEALEVIGEYAFNRCSALQEIILPNSVKTVGKRAFAECSAVTNLVMSENITSIGEYAFYDLEKTNGVNVYLPPTLTSLGKNAFSNGQDLYAWGNHTTMNLFYPEENYFEEYEQSLMLVSYKIEPNQTVSLNLKRHVKWNEEKKPNWKAVLQLVVPEKICGKEVVALTNSSTYPSWFTENEFKKTRDEFEIICPKHHYVISEILLTEHKSACAICADMVSEAHTYKDGVFACTKCGHIPFTLESSASEYAIRTDYKDGPVCNVKAICKLQGEALTYQWYENQTVITGATKATYVMPIGKASGNYRYTCEVSNGAFKATSTAVTITVFAPEVIDGLTLINPEYEIPKNGDFAKSTDGTGIYKVMATTGGLYEIEYDRPFDRNLTSVTIPDTVTIAKVTYKVTSIADNAFMNCKKLKNLNIGNNVKKIGTKAFYGCTSLLKVTGGKSLFTIGPSAFQNCKKLKSVSLSSKKLKTIGAKVFYGCKKLTKLTLKTTKLTKKSIGKNALKKTNKKLVIKVPKKKVSAYKKYFKGKGNNKAVVKK